MLNHAILSHLRQAPRGYLDLPWYAWQNLALYSIRINMKKYMCLLCGYIYDEAMGWPEDGIEPGTSWEKVPTDWLCPECGAGKNDFVMVEI